MPELPEVEVVRRGLDAFVSGRTVRGDGVEVHHPRAVRRHVTGEGDFAGQVAGATLGRARRRGKFLWLPLGDEAPGEPALVAHLGMSGQLLVEPGDAPDEAHLRVRLRFADGGRELRFVDQRTFGGMAVEPLVATADLSGDTVPRSVGHIARDPLDPAFDDDAFIAAVRRRRTGVKRALLDQTLVSGVGNIYADESLWRAGLHYERPTAGLRPVAVRALLGQVRDVLREAVAEGGTSFDSLYVNVNGESGWFDRSLAAYGREGEPCPRCGTPIRRERFTNRSSYFCPRCQRRPRARR